MIWPTRVLADIREYVHSAIVVTARSSGHRDQSHRGPVRSGVAGHHVIASRKGRLQDLERRQGAAVKIVWGGVPAVTKKSLPK